MTEIEALALRYYLAGFLYSGASYWDTLARQAENDSDLPERGLETIKWFAKEIADYRGMQNASGSCSRPIWKT